MSEASSLEPTPIPPVAEIESKVWRLGKDGVTISSVIERHVAFFADHEPEAIFFYAELGNSTELKNDEDTMAKVFKALSNVGMSNGQIVNAVNAMQNDGILFRERAV